MVLYSWLNEKVDILRLKAVRQIPETDTEVQIQSIV